MKIKIPELTIPELPISRTIISPIGEALKKGVDAGRFIITSAVDALPSAKEAKGQISGVTTSVKGNIVELLGIISNPHPSIGGKMIQIGSLAWSIAHTGEKVATIILAPQLRFLHNLAGGFTTDYRVARVTIKVGGVILNPEKNVIPRIMQVSDAATSIVELTGHLANMKKS